MPLPLHLRLVDGCPGTPASTMFTIERFRRIFLPRGVTILSGDRGTTRRDGSQGATSAATTAATPQADVVAAGGVPVAAEIAFHEAEELLAQLAGHRHDHGSGLSSESSGPAFPMGVVVVATVAAAALMALRRRGHPAAS